MANLNASASFCCLLFNANATAPPPPPQCSPAVDQLRALRLDPPEPIPQRCLQFPLHRVRLVARHPLPAPHLRVAEAPHRGRRAAVAPGRRERRVRRRSTQLWRGRCGVLVASLASAEDVALHDLQLPTVAGTGAAGAEASAVSAVVVGGGAENCPVVVPAEFAHLRWAGERRQRRDRGATARGGWRSGEDLVAVGFKFAKFRRME